MRIMADLDAVHLGLDENEADIAEELQHFDDSFDTRSEASESASESSDSQPSISSVSTTQSSKSKEKRKTKKIEKPTKESDKKTTTKRSATSIKNSTATASVNGKSSSKKKKESTKTADTSTDSVEQKKSDQSNDGKNSSRKKSIDNGQNSSNNINVSGSAKSEASDDESTKPKANAAPFDSDSESEDSDSAANIKRNGRKNTSKSSSPEKKTSSGSGAGGKGVSSYDYKTKLNYLFRDTRFFLIKSNNADNVGIAKSKSVWATLPQNDANLCQAFKEARNVLLIYSVNESGKFAGFARMSAASSRDIPQPPWVLPPSISSKALGGVIEIDWICRKELSFNCTSHLYNSWNEGKPVKIGRDGQEIEPKVGAELCRLFPEDEKIELTPILRKSKETAKMMREKGIRVIYKAPKSLSSRGGGGRGNLHYRSGGGSSGGDRRDGGGPMRHKRTFGGGPHRSYKLPYMGHPGSGYKRGGSPYGRGGPGGGPGGSGSSRAGGGDSSLPPWERYMTPTAAAEAYLADYMRTMHGQLPPLPFVPPFGQIPPPTAGGTSLPPPGMPASMFEQLPPGARYYDGPPLPDYPPPQPMRPPPPGYDKNAPSFEDFAAWKHAGLPTGALPPGFPSNMPGGNNSGSSGSAATGVGSSSAGGAGGSSNSNYRSNRNNNSNSNLNRSRDRTVRGNDFHHRGGGSAGGSSRSAGGDRDRHFRGANERSSGRNYRDNRR